MKLFDVVASLMPTEDEEKRGRVPQILFNDTIWGKSEDGARLVTVKKVAKSFELEDDAIQRLEVAVRPFCC